MNAPHLKFVRSFAGCRMPARLLTMTGLHATLCPRALEPAFSYRIGANFSQLFPTGASRSPRSWCTRRNEYIA